MKLKIVLLRAILFAATFSLLELENMPGTYEYTREIQVQEEDTSLNSTWDDLLLVLFSILIVVLLAFGFLAVFRSFGYWWTE